MEGVDLPIVQIHIFVQNPVAKNAAPGEHRGWQATHRLKGSGSILVPNCKAKAKRLRNEPVAAS